MGIASQTWIYSNHLKNMLQCRFWLPVLGWSWDATFLTSSDFDGPLPALSGAGILTTDYLCPKRSVLSGLSLSLQIWPIVDLGACDFNQQLKFTYSCRLPQSTIPLQARTMLHSVFLLLKSQETCLTLTSCSVNAFLKSDFNKHLYKLINTFHSH